MTWRLILEAGLHLMDRRSPNCGQTGLRVNQVLSIKVSLYIPLSSKIGKNNLKIFTKGITIKNYPLFQLGSNPFPDRCLEKNSICNPWSGSFQSNATTAQLINKMPFEPKTGEIKMFNEIFCALVYHTSLQYVFGTQVVQCLH